MKKRQQKKNQKKIYKNMIEDVAWEISLDSYWRNRIFNLPLKQVLDIGYIELENIPEYIKKEVLAYKLIFGVERVKSCKVHFDDGLIIFKFYAKEYPHIIKFTGNNPQII